ncbi:MAG: hypothetical protein PHU25_14530 [Deltaproteobacteria bacterium]|nr:hypothetical protein [Deltaproteobacteria bacterium]
MRTYVQHTMRFGDLVAAIFDRAAQYDTDPKEVSLLATRVVTYMLRHAREMVIPLSPRR